MKEEKTMSVKEYLAQKEQNEIDLLFDKAIKEAKEQQIKELKVKEHKDYMNGLFTKIADYESEVLILEDIYRQAYENYNTSHEDLNKLKDEIKNAKIRLTKVQNELDREIVKERLSI